MSLWVEIVSTAWTILLKSSVYMLLGFFVAGLLSVYMKPEMIRRYLGRGRVRPVFMSALMGIPLPLCSCGVVPAAAGLKRQGANRGATLSFLISTPETGVDSIPVTYALMDPVMTVIRPVAAFVTAVVAGIAENFFGRSNRSGADPSPANISESRRCCSAQGAADKNISPRKTAVKKLMQGMQYAFVELLGDIGPWFLFGVLLAGIISCIIPDNFTESFPGGHFAAMLIMLVAGVPMYICATSSTPIAAALVLKGLSPGAALVFLLSGPATNVASMTMVGKLLGKRSLVIYLGAIAACSLAFGVFTDWVYMKLGVSARTIVASLPELMPPSIEIAAVIILLILIVNARFRAYKEKKSCSCGSVKSTEPLNVM